MPLNRDGRPVSEPGTGNSDILHFGFDAFHMLPASPDAPDHLAAGTREGNKQTSLGIRSRRQQELCQPFGKLDRFHGRMYVALHRYASLIGVVDGLRATIMHPAWIEHFQ